MEDKKIRVVVAEDHQLVRKGFCSLLSQIDEVELVGDVSNGKEVLDLFKRGVHADVALLDYEMPVMNGLQTLEQIKKDYFGVKVIILTMLNSKELIQEAIGKGANGFLFKNTSIEELGEAIIKVARGETYFTGEVTLSLLRPIQNGADKSLNSLTDREIEIIKLVVQGLSSTEIGAQLYISPRTVDTHRNNIIQKLGVKGIPGLVKFAIDKKIINSLN